MTPTSASPRPAFGKRLFAGVVATLFALLLAELALRLLDLPGPSRDFHHLRSLGQKSSMFVPDRELFWRMAPGDPFEPANQLGLRGPLPSPRHGDRDLVVACVGDSCTFGAGVRYDDTYGARLGLMLQRALPDRRVDVVLSALGGFTTHQDKVLFERLLAKVAPDVTIFYTGLFNDYSPAIGSDDFARAHPPWLHLQRLFDRAQESEAEIERAKADFVASRHVIHPRVPLDRYRDNLEQMLGLAQSRGCRTVLTILPPRTPRMFAIYADGQAYLDATKDFATAHDLPGLDPMARFDEFIAAVPADLRKGEDPWPCFVDVGHPSVLGHRLIAEMLFDALRDRLELQPHEVPSIEVQCERMELPAFRAGTLVIATPIAAQVDRAWLGDQWIPIVTATDDLHLRLELPPLLQPGEHALELRTAAGLVHTERTWKVTALALRARAERRDDGGIDLHVDGEGPSGWSAGVWIQPALRAIPRATRFGSLWIDVAFPGEDRAPARAPYRFDRLPPAPLTAQVGADSTWSAQVTVPKDAKVPDRVFLQAFLTDPERPWFGALSATVELQPR